MPSVAKATVHLHFLTAAALHGADPPAPALCCPSWWPPPYSVPESRRKCGYPQRPFCRLHFPSAFSYHLESSSEAAGKTCALARLGPLSEAGRVVGSHGAFYPRPARRATSGLGQVGKWGLLWALVHWLLLLQRRNGDDEPITQFIGWLGELATVLGEKTLCKRRELLGLKGGISSPPLASQGPSWGREILSTYTTPYAAQPSVG